MNKHFFAASILLLFLCLNLTAHAYDPSYIRNWLICGPFENANLEDPAIAGEADLSPKGGAVSSAKTWKEYDSVEDFVDLQDETALGRYDFSVAYAFVEINSPRDKLAKLYLHSDDGIKVWLNGNNILTNDIARGMGEEDILTIALGRGQNRLMVKVSDLSGDWMFSARITDENGDVIKDLAYSPRPIPLEKLPVKRIWASSVQQEDLEQYNPAFAVDGKNETRWSSEHSDPQFLILDFGSPQEIKRINLLWETAYSKSYKIEISDDKISWREIFLTDKGDGGKDTVSFPEVQKGRYLRLFLLERGTEWGNSLYELSVYGFVSDGAGQGG